MKNFIIISLLLFSIAATASVYRGEIETPVSTTAIENFCTLTGEGNSDGAFDFTYELCNAGTFVPDMRLAEIHWCADEEFYRNGYKAKLSDAVKEINAPPDNKIYRDIPFKIGWC